MSWQWHLACVKVVAWMERVVGGVEVGEEGGGCVEWSGGLGLEGRKGGAEERRGGGFWRDGVQFLIYDFNSTLKPQVPKPEINTPTSSRKILLIVSIVVIVPFWGYPIGSKYINQ